MGVGDEIMGSGMARGFAQRGKRAAFGSAGRIQWGPYCEQVYRHNPNVAPPGSERDGDLEWIDYRRGNRGYNKQSGGRWIWNMGFRAPRGEFFFTDQERDIAGQARGRGAVVIEPRTPRQKTCWPNKQWPRERYQTIADVLRARGCDVVQFAYGDKPELLRGVRVVATPTFRHAAAFLELARLYVGPEGGLHHAAAATGTPAVVLFGSWIPPSVTGYDGHINVAIGDQGCGEIGRCEHCIAAMASISVETVTAAIMRAMDEAMAS